MKPSLWRRVRGAGLVGVALAIWAAPAGAETLKIDPQHSTVSFRVRHLFSKVTGQFRKFEGTIELDETNLAASKVSALIDVASIDTNVEARDKDLRSPRFFDVAKYPNITFTNGVVAEASGKKGKIKGILGMHGIAHLVELSTEYLGKVKDPWGNLKYAFHAETTVNRKDYGMTWNEAIEAGGVMVGDEVEIILDIEAATPPKQ